MTIVGIVGIMDFAGSRSRLWKHFNDAFLEQFPDVRFEVAHRVYFPWQYRRIRAYAARIVRQFDTGDDLILLGYSLGGVIAEDVAPRFKKSRVLLVVSVCAPDRFRAFSYFLSGLHAPQCAVAPAISFSAQYDFLVPPVIVRASANPRQSLFSDHLFAFLYGTSAAQHVAATTTEAYRQITQGVPLKGDILKEVW